MKTAFEKFHATIYDAAIPGVITSNAQAQTTAGVDPDAGFPVTLPSYAAIREQESHSAPAANCASLIAQGIKVDSRYHVIKARWPRVDGRPTEAVRDLCDEHS